MGIFQPIIGYKEVAVAANSSPSNTTTYYFGSLFVVLTTTASTSKILIPKAGKITAATIFITNVAGSSETSTMSVRLNNSTDTVISSTVNLSSTSFATVTSGLSITVAQGDFVEIKWVTPTWTLPPTSVRVSVTLYIEP